MEVRASTVARFVAALIVLLMSSVGHAGPAVADPQPTSFVVHDQRISEASGIARGVRTPDVLYVQNDSGDSARFFAIDATTGATRAVITVPGAQNHDWEDLAVAPDVRGVSSVWLADIGDNGEQRSSVQIYRVDEPRLSAAANQTVTAQGMQRWDFRYPDGPHNAEGFTIDPVHRLMYVVTKSGTNHTKVFRASITPSTGEQTFDAVATVTFPPDSLLDSGELVTGAAYSPTLKLFVVRTYLAGFWWPVRDGDVAHAVGATPTRFSLPPERQAEGIGFDGDHLWVNSEGIDQPVYRVPVPAAALRAGTGSAVPSGSLSTSPSARPSPDDGVLPGSESEPPAWQRPPVLAGVGALLLIAGLVGRRLSRRI